MQEKVVVSVEFPKGHLMKIIKKTAIKYIRAGLKIH